MDIGKNRRILKVCHPQMWGGAEFNFTARQAIEKGLTMAASLNAILAARKLTQAEAARLLGVNQPKISALRIARRAVVSLVEGQEARCRAGKASCHLRLGIGDGEVNQRAARKAEQRFGGLPPGLGMPVKAVLVDGILHALGEVGLQFDCGDGQAIEEEGDVEAVLIRLGVAP